MLKFFTFYFSFKNTNFCLGCHLAIVYWNNIRQWSDTPSTCELFLPFHKNTIRSLLQLLTNCAGGSMRLSAYPSAVGVETEKHSKQKAKSRNWQRAAPSRRVAVECQHMHSHIHTRAHTLAVSGIENHCAPTPPPPPPPAIQQASALPPPATLRRMIAQSEILRKTTKLQEWITKVPC